MINFTQHNLTIFNNISEQNYHDKPVCNNVNKLNHSSPMNNTATSKIKHFPQLHLQAHKYPSNKNDTIFFYNQP